MAPRLPTLRLHCGLLIAATDFMELLVCPEDRVPTSCLHTDDERNLACRA